MLTKLAKSLVVLALGFAPLAATPATAQDSTLNLQHNLHRVQRWIGSGPNAEGWRRYLHLGDLESLSALGVHADPGYLQQSLQHFDSNAYGLDHPHFLALRNAIYEHANTIQLAQSSIIVIDEAEGFVEISDSKLDQARLELLDEVRMLKQYFYENLWGIDRPKIMRQLQVNELIELLASTNFLDPNTEVEGDERYDQRQRKILLVARKLRELKPEYRIASSLIGNFHIQLVEIRLEHLEQLCTYGFNPEATTRIYARSLEGFNEQVGKLGDFSDRRAQLLVGQGLGWLSRLGQDPAIGTAIRQQYSKPNFKLAVTESLVNQFASRRPVQDARWVDEVVLDNRVQGFAYTNGSIQVDFLNDPLQAYFSINLNGTVTSDTKTKKGPITGYSSSFAEFSGHRTVVANVGGLIEYDADATANLTSDFLGTSCSLNLINRIAVNQYLQRKLRSEQIGSERAEKLIFEKFDEETLTELEKGKVTIAEAHLSYFDLLREVSQFRHTFSKAGKPEFDDQGNLYELADVMDPIRLPEGMLKTTDSELNVVAYLEGWNRLGAVNDPPLYSFPADVRVQLHESMLSNLVAPFLDGKTFKSSEFAEIADSFAGDIPSEFALDGEDEFTVTFETGQPIQFAFEDQKLGLIINGSNFEKDGRDTGPMFVRLNLKIVNIDGQLKLIRDGAPKIDFSEPGTRSVEQITARTLIQEQLDELTDKDPLEGAIDLPDNFLPIKQLEEMEGFEGLDDVKKFRLVQCKSELGWLTLGWSYDPVASTPDNSVQSYMMDTPAIHPMQMPQTKDGFIGTDKNLNEVVDE